MCNFFVISRLVAISKGLRCTRTHLDTSLYLKLSPARSILICLASEEHFGSVLEMMYVHARKLEKQMISFAFMYTGHARAGVNRKQRVYSVVGCLDVACLNNSLPPVHVGSCSIKKADLTGKQLLAKTTRPTTQHVIHAAFTSGSGAWCHLFTPRKGSRDRTVMNQRRVWRDP